MTGYPGYSYCILDHLVKTWVTFFFHQRLHRIFLWEIGFNVLQLVTGTVCFVVRVAALSQIFGKCAGQSSLAKRAPTQCPGRPTLKDANLNPADWALQRKVSLVQNILIALSDPSFLFLRQANACLYGRGFPFTIARGCVATWRRC